MGVNMYLLKKNSAYNKENCYYTDNILNFHTLSYVNTKKKENSVFVDIYFKTIPVTYGEGCSVWWSSYFVYDHFIR